jgi:hypothetical protein
MTIRKGLGSYVMIRWSLRSYREDTHKSLFGFEAKLTPGSRSAYSAFCGMLPVENEKQCDVVTVSEGTVNGDRHRSMKESCPPRWVQQSASSSRNRCPIRRELGRGLARTGVIVMSRHQSTRCGLKVFTLREKGTARSGPALRQASAAGCDSPNESTSIGASRQTQSPSRGHDGKGSCRKKTPVQC